MKKERIFTVTVLLTLATACGQVAAKPQPTSTSSPVPTATATFTPLPSPTSTATLTSIPTPTRVASYPPAGQGPTGFPSGVDPLTGLAVGNPAVLGRRPLAIKVSNEPRYPAAMGAVPGRHCL